MKFALHKKSWIGRCRTLAGVAVGSALLAGCGNDVDDNEDFAGLDRSTEALADQNAERSNTQQQGAQAQNRAQQSGQASMAPQGARVKDSAEIALREEQLNVETRQEAAGGVLLRKTVTSEPVSESVELRSEDIEVVRLSPEEARQRMESGASSQFNEEFAEEEVFIPIMREEAVASKDVATREVVRASTETNTEQREIEATLRSEELETERMLQDDAQTQRSQQQLAASGQDSQSQALRNQVIERIRSETDLNDQQIEQIEVEVNDREVVLSGSVPNEEVKSQIRDGVQQIEGVASVAMNF